MGVGVILRSQIELFRNGSAGITTSALQHHTDALTDFIWFRSWVHAKDFNASRRWLREALAHFDGGSFTCTVWAKQGNDAPARNREVECIDCRGISKTFADVVEHHGGRAVDRGVLEAIESFMHVTHCRGEVLRCRSR